MKLLHLLDSRPYVLIEILSERACEKIKSRQLIISFFFYPVNRTSCRQGDTDIPFAFNYQIFKGEEEVESFNFQRRSVFSNFFIVEKFLSIRKIVFAIEQRKKETRKDSRELEAKKTCLW